MQRGADGDHGVPALLACRVATRYEKTDTAYMSMLFLAGAVFWTR